MKHKVTEKGEADRLALVTMIRKVDEIKVLEKAPDKPKISQLKNTACSPVAYMR